MLSRCPSSLLRRWKPGPPLPLSHPQAGTAAGGRWRALAPSVATTRAHFAEQQRGNGFDLALIAIGAYEPNWFMHTVHVNPEESVKIFQDLGARHAAAMHWGTFRLTLEALDEPPRRLLKALDEAGIARERFFVMQHGETRRIAALLQP